MRLDDFRDGLSGTVMGISGAVHCPVAQLRVCNLDNTHMRRGGSGLDLHLKMGKPSLRDVSATHAGSIQVQDGPLSPLRVNFFPPSYTKKPVALVLTMDELHS
jgi:hypothetical protein